MLFNNADEQLLSQVQQDLLPSHPSPKQPLLTPWQRENLGRPMIRAVAPIPTLGVVVLPISPRPAERPRFSKFAGTYNSKSYSDYKKRLVEALKAKIAQGQIPPADYAGLSVDFYLPIPKSWSGKEKKQASETMHRKKPDADNFLKAISDALEEAGVFVNDGQVAQMSARKWYVQHPANGEHLPDEMQPRIEFRLHTYDQLINQLL